MHSKRRCRKLRSSPSNKAQLRFATKDFTINVASSPLHFVDKIKSLGVYIDSNLSMDVQVNAACRSCNYQIRAFRQIRPNLSAIANTLKSEVILKNNYEINFRQDNYINSLLEFHSKLYTTYYQRQTSKYLYNFR